MIFCRWKCMVTLNRNWFQNWYYGCLSENLITILLGTQTMVDSKNQEYNQWFYIMFIISAPIRNIYHQDTRSCVVVNAAYLPKLYIHHHCHGEIIILKKSRISAKMLKTEGLGKNQIAYMKHMKIQSFHMGVIFTPKHMIWQRQKYVYTHSQIMRYHTRNVHWDVIVHLCAELPHKLPYWQSPKPNKL